MKNAAIHLVKYALEKGNVISVFDEEEWAVNRSSKYQEIMDAINSVDEPELRIFNKNDAVIGWALIVNGLEPDETVADHSTTDFMSDWSDTYNREYTS